jgi:chromate transporter
VNGALGILGQLALRIGALGCVAVGGGNALVPALHDAAVTSMHWMNEAAFAEAVGLSQAAPGPNMLLMPLIGWYVAGIAGALVALVAFLVPTTTIAIVGSRWLVRHAHTDAVTSLRWALRPVSGGLMLSAGVVLVATAARAWPRTSPAATAGAALVAAGVAGAALRYKCNPLVWLAACACLGALVT